MVQPTLHSPLADLYESDETAWLEATAELVREGNWGQIDPGTLAEYLNDMALRDKRETLSRLKVLIAHLLKWQFQPENRCVSWRRTINGQREELQDVLESRTLYKHAEDILAKAYRRGVNEAIAETGCPKRPFPKIAPGRWTRSCRTRFKEIHDRMAALRSERIHSVDVMDISRATEKDRN